MVSHFCLNLHFFRLHVYSFKEYLPENRSTNEIRPAQSHHSIVPLIMQFQHYMLAIALSVALNPFIMTFSCYNPSGYLSYNCWAIIQHCSDIYEASHRINGFPPILSCTQIYTFCISYLLLLDKLLSKFNGLKKHLLSHVF